MTARERFAAAALATLERLLAETGASRTTLRLDDAALGLHVDDVAAEALAPGQASMRGDGTIDHRAAQTARWLEAQRRLLVQDDLTATEFPAPAALVEGFGVKAQMLAPIERDGRLDGWVSVHEAKAARPWTEADRAAARTASAEIGALLKDTWTDATP